MNKKDYDRKFMAENCITVRLQLNKKNDADIIAKLNEQTNKNGYLKNLIRKDIEMKEIRTYIYQDSDNCGDFTYSSYGRKGSEENYEDFRSAYIKRFGKYLEKPTWENYKKWCKFNISIYE